MARCVNQKTEIKSKIIGIQIDEVQIQHVKKQIFILCEQQISLFAVNSLSYKLLLL